MKKALLIILLCTMLAACGSAPAEQAAVQGATGVVHEVTIADFKFSPSELTINKGDTVKWTNKDSAPHTATANNGAWDSDRLEPGDSWEWTFGDVGSVDYKCAIHPSMLGKITIQ